MNVNWLKRLRLKGPPALPRFGRTIPNSKVCYWNVNFSASSGATWQEVQWQMCNMWIFEAELSGWGAQQSVSLGAGPGFMSFQHWHLWDTRSVSQPHSLFHFQNYGQKDTQSLIFRPKDRIAEKFFCLPNLHIKQSTPHYKKGNKTFCISIFSSC